MDYKKYCDKCGLMYSSYCIGCQNVIIGLNLTLEQYLELCKLRGEDNNKMEI